MITVSLNDLKFEAFHGVYDEEKILGSSYIVDCEMRLNEPGDAILRIDETVDYSKVFDIIRSRMQVPTTLLETLCMETGSLIHESFPEVKSILIKVKKLHPPIEGFSGSSSVSWLKEY